MARISTRPRTITDLGCGPGHLAPVLRARWPDAEVVGIDSSAEMIEAARAAAPDPQISYQQADLRSWTPPAPVDLVISNATLQWVPDHLDLLPALAARVAAGGVLAFSVPGNFAEPSHVLLRDLAAQQPYRRWTAGVAEPHAHDALVYLDLLATAGWEVDAWETTYLHVLSGTDPVFDWISGTGARPVLTALPEPVRQRFVATYQRRLSEAYPARPIGTVLPFRRVFVVARRVDASPVRRSA